LEQYNQRTLGIELREAEIRKDIEENARYIQENKTELKVLEERSTNAKMFIDMNKSIVDSINKVENAVKHNTAKKWKES
jgi:hypothetical protein